MASQIEDFFTSLTGMPLMGGTEPIPVAPTVATAPVSAGPAPQLADVVGTPPAQPSSVFGDERTREKLQAIFAALSQNPNGRSPVEHLGTALTTGYKVGEARKQQTKDEQRKAVEEGQKDAQTKLGLEKGQYELDKAKKVDPIALKTAELAYQTATTDAERKKAEFELWQIWGPKKAAAELAKLQAEARHANAQVATASGKNPYKYGSQEYADFQRAKLAPTFKVKSDVIKDGQISSTEGVDEERFSNYMENPQYPTEAEIAAGATPGKKPKAAAPKVAAGYTLDDFRAAAKARNSKDVEGEAARAFAKYQATQK